MPHSINIVYPLRRAGVGPAPIECERIKVNRSAERHAEVDTQTETIGKGVKNEDLSRVGVGYNTPACVFTKPYFVSHFVFNYLAVKQPVVVQIGAIVAVDA